ncbi:unnamed protein product [Rotaria sp. Silwood1]|nr:unnamed protein product [Rotaria sp. Silwood1]CAF1657406.1 unnamed protein product [Rotaria sp. Silwood1]CAF3686799.1 unnamed protein product [Rotaria sp. Silwood1]CAF5020925.1 unnamed protein product [Rotaria sp. Silwood1]
MPSHSFCTLIIEYINHFYNDIVHIVSSTDLILLFTRLNSIFKQLLSRRLRQLTITNDSGPQYTFLTNDLLYYIKQIQTLPGLEILELHIDEILITN